MVEMATIGTSFGKMQRNLQKLSAVLQSAACEWLLIFLLLINAVLSYLLTKFASCCRLQIPCIFCSRLDHLGNEKAGFYNRIICSNHRSEISSLISCHIHGKLADGCGMCEECLLSITMKSKPNPNVHRLLVGGFEFDIGASGFDSSLRNREIFPGYVDTKTCSCCNKAWRSRKPSNKIITQLKSPRIGMTKPNIPLPSHLTHRESLKKMGEKLPGSVRSHRLLRCDPRSHVGYTELKFTSDSESEFPFSDDDDSSSIGHTMKLKEEPKSQHSSEVPPKILTDDGRQQAYRENYPSALLELISLDDCPSSSSAMDIPVGVSSESSECKFPPTENYNLYSLPDLISLYLPSSFDAVEGAREASQKKLDDTGIGDGRTLSIDKHKKMLNLTASTRGGGQVAKEVPSVKSLDIELVGVCKPDSSSERREECGFMTAEQTPNQPESNGENFKELRTENAFAEGPDLSLKNTVTKMEGHSDGLQMIDALRTNVVQTERTESSGLESIDGSLVSEIEGESIIDQLKRQVEYDRIRISALYEELEEERSASAIAANQAMAMITRLQEEKAALHMEALQYLRMMEEQAEYDVEALEKANDLLADKEKEILDLEAEVEYLRLNFPDETRVETMPVESYHLKGKNSIAETTSTKCDDANFPCSSLFGEIWNDGKKPVNAKSSLSEYEGEKKFILQRLKSLGRKLKQFSCHGPSEFMSNSSYFEEVAHGARNEGESLKDEGTQINGQMKEDDFPEKKDSRVSNGSLPAHVMYRPYSIEEDQSVCDECSDMVFNGQQSSKQYTEIDLVALGNEISDLLQRLEALEFDRNFL